MYSKCFNVKCFLSSYTGGQRTFLVHYGGGGECLPLQVVRGEMERFSLDRQVRGL